MIRNTTSAPSRTAGRSGWFAHNPPSAYSRPPSNMGSNANGSADDATTAPTRSGVSTTSERTNSASAPRSAASFSFSVFEKNTGSPVWRSVALKIT